MIRIIIHIHSYVSVTMHWNSGELMVNHMVSVWLANLRPIAGYLMAGGVRMLKRDVK